MENQETFKCHVCNEEFDQYSLELHFITKHNMEDEKEIKKSSFVHEEEIKNICKIYENIFSSKYNAESKNVSCIALTVTASK